MTGRHLRQRPTWRTHVAGTAQRVLAKLSMRRLPLVLQQTLTDCAPACLVMILGALGQHSDLAELRDELGSGRDGVSAAAIRDVDVHRNLKYRALRVSVDELHRLPTPFIAHWHADHFVVVTRIGRRRVSIADPAIGRRRPTRQEFTDGYSGVVQLFAAPEPAPPKICRRSAPWRQVLKQAASDQRGAIALLAAASAALLVAGLATPALTAALVSWIGSPNNARAADGPWTIIGAGVALALVVGSLSLGRGLITSRIQLAVGRNLTGSLVRRLLRAPLLFFEHRGRGDVISRVTSTEAVRDAVATSLVAAVLDAVTAVGYVAIVLVLQPAVGLLTALLAVTQLLILGLLAVQMQRVRREELLAEARATGNLMEAVSGIAWLKAAGAEADVTRTWTGLYEERLRGLRRSARLAAVADAVATTFRTLGPLAVLMTAGMVVVGEHRAQEQPVDSTAIGAVVGVAALAAAALIPFSSLATHLRSLLELSAVAAHLGDLMSAPAEPTGNLHHTLNGAISVRGLSFQHTRRAPWVVKDVDLDVSAGQKVAIVGASGSGKSTLAKLLVGLYSPTEGEVRLNGHPLSQLDLASVRKQIGVVLQEPFLVTGSLQDNIALRRPSGSFDEIVSAAVAAGVHHDIMRMPFGYQTLVTEGGVGLSGGQRQRIAIARALLGHPRLLVLDEATSHVDQATEAQIEANLRILGVTQIVIAHRLSTIRDADLILVLEQGRIVERGDHNQLVQRGGRYADLLGTGHDNPDSARSMVAAA